ncbi:hypothetical protein HDU79_010567 [Rhizoclosmatium sp. JEL0117]|nr:hypothetical protein HDU79_010567 [Rhizoclosmatium sp. JEL0117]
MNSKRIAQLAAVFLLALVLWFSTDALKRYKSLPKKPIQNPEVPIIREDSIYKLTYNDKIVDLMQIQFLDYLNGELGMKEDDVFGGSLTKSYSYRDKWQYLHSFNKRIAKKGYDIRFFHRFALRARAALISYRILYEAPPALLQDLATLSPEPSLTEFKASLLKVIEDVTKLLYPWINPPFTSIAQMHMSFLSGPDVGIVITCGTKQFYMAKHLILTLREVWNINLPIEVFYSGEEDLHPSMIKSFNEMENVRAVNLLAYFYEETYFWSGWSVKPFAMLASRFRTVIFMDADILFFKNPLSILNTPQFLKTGTYFYRDRKKREDMFVKGTILLSGIAPHLSRYGRTLEYTNQDPKRYTTTHMMESGLVVMDKGRSGVLFSLLMAAKMNGVRERNWVLYRMTYGDKEAFWFSTELMRVPYYFNPSHGGVIGKTTKITSNAEGYTAVCGVWLLHIDQEGDPFWWNGGGVLRNRTASKDFDFEDFTHIATHRLEGSVNGNVWVSPGNGHCLNQTNEQVFKLTSEQQSLIEQYKDIFRYRIQEIPLN